MVRCVVNWQASSGRMGGRGSENRKGTAMNKPTLYVTFSGPGSHAFGPYVSASLEPADYAYEVLVLLVSATGHNPGNEVGDGHCLAARVGAVWKLGDGSDEEEDGPGYERVTIRQRALWGESNAGPDRVPPLACCGRSSSNSGAWG
jgi:hypothetical protein